MSENNGHTPTAGDILKTLLYRMRNGDTRDGDFISAVTNASPDQIRQALQIESSHGGTLPRRLRRLGKRAERKARKSR